MSPIHSADIAIDVGIGGAADSGRQHLQQAAPAKDVFPAKQRAWIWVRNRSVQYCACTRCFTKLALCPSRAGEATSVPDQRVRLPRAGSSDSGDPYPYLRESNLPRLTHPKELIDEHGE